LIVYSKQEMLRFLSAVDVNLVEPTELILIGGAAAAIAYDVTRATRDIDTWSALEGDILKAVEVARAQSCLDIPVEHAAVADAPWRFEDRLLRLDISGWSRLRVLVPERHDLVLMKCVRGYEHDLEIAASIEQTQGLDLDTLLTRFLDEMTHIIGDPGRLDLNFRALVERLYGEANEVRVARAIRVRRHES